MTRPVQAPPSTAELTEAFTHEALVRDAAAYRLIGEAGWVLIRRSELEELETVLAEMIAQCQTTAREVMPTQSPNTTRGEVQ